MNYIDILNNPKVIENYNKIDEINPYPFNHGLRHVKNVCKIMDNLCDTLNISGEEKEALLIAAALHDIGQVDGREEHGKKAADFLIDNFEEQLKNNSYYDDMISAISCHDYHSTTDYPLFTILVQFCDKMDFSKERLEYNYRDKFRYYCWEDVTEVRFIYDDNNFGINIITPNLFNFEELFLQENFSTKIINVVKVLADKLDRNPIFLNNGTPMTRVI